MKVVKLDDPVVFFSLWLGTCLFLLFMVIMNIWVATSNHESIAKNHEAIQELQSQMKTIKQQVGP